MFWKVKPTQIPKVTAGTSWMSRTFWCVNCWNKTKTVKRVTCQRLYRRKMHLNSESHDLSYFRHASHQQRWPWKLSERGAIKFTYEVVFVVENWKGTKLQPLHATEWVKLLHWAAKHVIPTPNVSKKLKRRTLTWFGLTRQVIKN